METFVHTLDCFLRYQQKSVNSLVSEYAELKVNLVHLSVSHKTLAWWLSR